MHRANQVVAQVLGELVERVEPGVSTGELDEYAEARVRELGGDPQGALPIEAGGGVPEGLKLGLHHGLH